MKRTILAALGLWVIWTYGMIKLVDYVEMASHWGW